jgi:hypothetical protein
MDDLYGVHRVTTMQLYAVEIFIQNALHRTSLVQANMGVKISNAHNPEFI